jgi:hypothetical protein
MKNRYMIVSVKPGSAPMDFVTFMENHEPLSDEDEDDADDDDEEDDDSAEYAMNDRPSSLQSKRRLGDALVETPSAKKKRKNH